MATIRDHPEKSRYELDTGGEPAFLLYRRKQPGVVELIHTEVPVPERGKGYADQLARHALEQAQASGERVKIICPFVATYVERHPEYQPLLA